MRLAFFLFLISFTCGAQGWGDNDSLRVLSLHQRGIKIERGRVIAWFPKDSLSVDRMSGIVDTLDLGIRQAEIFLKNPHPWQVFAEVPLTYYFSPDRFISHASWEGFVFIPLWRIKESKAPWLHEALHVLLRSNKGSWGDVSFDERKKLMPLWLTEGLPDYIDATVSSINKLPRFDLWGDGGLQMTDANCISKLEGPDGDYILGFIGSEGPLPELFGERRRDYSPTFYNCAFSFSKYISDQYGAEVLIDAISNFKTEHKVIEKKTAKSMGQLKKDWLVKIGKVK